jgi:hypothetical protein
VAVSADADDDQDGGLLLLQPRLEVETVGEDVDVAFRQRPASPEPVFVLPFLLETQDAGRRERCRRPHQLAEDGLEIAVARPSR